MDVLTKEQRRKNMQKYSFERYSNRSNVEKGIVCKGYQV